MTQKNDRYGMTSLEASAFRLWESVDRENRELVRGKRLAEISLAFLCGMGFMFGVFQVAFWIWL